MQSIKREIRWMFMFFTFIIGSVAILAGCGGGDNTSSTTSTGSISGKVAGTIIVAINAENEILANVEAQGETGNKTFTLGDLPLNEMVSLYLITDGGTYPMVLRDNTVDAFKLSSSTTLELGFISVDSVNKTARPLFEPATENISSSGKRSTIPYVFNDPDQWGVLGRSVDALLTGGIGAARNQWAAGTYAYAQQANIRARGQTSLNKTRMLLAFSRLASIGMDTRYDGTASDHNRVGDFLNLFGCDNDTNPGMLYEDFVCPDTIPSTAPTGTDVSTFLSGTVAIEFQTALDTLEEITDSSFSTSWAAIDSNFDGRVADDEPLGEWIDINDDEIIDTGELTSNITLETAIDKKLVTDRIDIDYGDVLIFKAWLQYNLAQIQINQAYDWEISISQSQGLTKEQFLANNPNAGTLSTTASTHLASAKSLLAKSANTLIAAVDAIQAETDKQGADLFTIDALEVTSTKQNLQDFISSLDTTTLFSESRTQLTLNLSRFFSGLNLRVLLPSVSGDEWNGLFPDATLGGTLAFGENINQDEDDNGIPDLLEAVSCLAYATATGGAGVTTASQSAGSIVYDGFGQEIELNLNENTQVNFSFTPIVDGVPGTEIIADPYYITADNPIVGTDDVTVGGDFLLLSENTTYMVTYTTTKQEITFNLAKSADVTWTFTPEISNLLYYEGFGVTIYLSPYQEKQDLIVSFVFTPIVDDVQGTPVVIDPISITADSWMVSTDELKIGTAVPSAFLTENVTYSVAYTATTPDGSITSGFTPIITDGVEIVSDTIFLDQGYQTLDLRTDLFVSGEILSLTDGIRYNISYVTTPLSALTGLVGDDGREEIIGVYCQ